MFVLCRLEGAMKRRGCEDIGEVMKFAFGLG